MSCSWIRFGPEVTLTIYSTTYPVKTDMFKLTVKLECMYSAAYLLMFSFHDIITVLHYMVVVHKPYATVISSLHFSWLSSCICMVCPCPFPDSRKVRISKLVEVQFMRENERTPRPLG